MKNQLLLTFGFFLLTLTLYGQDCTQSAEVQDARSKMNSGDNGLMCGQVAQYYAMKCQCENGLPTQEAASQLAKQLNAAAKAYNDYGMPCSGYSKLSTVGNCKVGSIGTSESSKRTFSNTVIFSDAELGQLEQMAKESGNENWMYRVKTMKEFHETAKMAKALAPGNKQLTAMENTGQIFNLFMAPLQKKLEEEEAARKAKEEELTRQALQQMELMERYRKESEAAKNIALIQEKLVQYLIYQKYFIYYRSARLSYLYENNAPNERVDYLTSLVERYQEFPMYDSLFKISEQVLKLISFQQNQRIASENLLEVMQVDRTITGHIETDYKAILSRSVYTKSFEEIIGSLNPILVCDIIIELKNSSAIDKYDLIIDYVLELKRSASQSSYMRSSSSAYLHPDILVTLINALSEEKLAGINPLLESVSFDVNSYNTLGIDLTSGKKLKISKIIQANGFEKVFNLIQKDVSGTLIQNNLLLRQGKYDEVIKKHNSFLERMEKLAQSPISDIKNFMSFIPKEKDEYFKKELYNIKVLKTLHLINDLHLTAVDANLKKDKKDVSVSIYVDYFLPTLYQIVTEDNFPRLALAGSIMEINKNQINANSHLVNDMVSIWPRYEYYHKLLGQGEIGGAKALILHDLDRTHFDLTEFNQYYGIGK